MLFDKIKKKIKVGVIGLGYVGLPRAIQFCNKNIQVYGIDNDFKKVEILNKGRSYITNLKKKRYSKKSQKKTFYSIKRFFNNKKARCNNYLCTNTFR